ncbi:MAG: hypothetical protein GC201_05835 [Alphaproteobacteria bacterium]|nr:hypothetical protein [Alphaproteobacteria bacterium]
MQKLLDFFPRWAAALLVACACCLIATAAAHAANCPPTEAQISSGEAVAGNDLDGDGKADWTYPKFRVDGDTANPPNCILRCVTNHGRVPLFYLICGGKVVHRCPYIGALNRFKLDATGKYSGSSTESENSAGKPHDDDNNGKIERVEYEQVQRSGQCVLIIRTYWDDTLVDTREVPCPESIDQLPWPKEPEKPKPTPVLPWPWLIAVILTGVGVAGAVVVRRGRARSGGR